MVVAGLLQLFWGTELLLRHLDTCMADTCWILNPLLLVQEDRAGTHLHHRHLHPVRGSRAVQRGTVQF